MPDAGLLVCTRKGLIVGHSRNDRHDWTWQPLAFGGWKSDFAVHDPRTDTLWAALSHEQWGPRLHRSNDSGQSWQEAAVPQFDDDHTSLESIWTLTPDGHGALYAGVAPGALFVSHDDGHSWTRINSLSEHPTSADWQPGAAGLSFHHVSVDPHNPQRIYAAGSATGLYVSEDRGHSWEPRNQGVRADFAPPEWDGVAGHCIHSFHAHPNRHGRLWQQNHFGQYRSDDDGRSWTEIGQNHLPGDFGFASAIDPQDPDAAWFVPLDFDQMRMPRDGALAVYRTRDAGTSWTALTHGLPQHDFHQSIYRQALATDTLHPLGLYLGSSGGELYASRDSGDHWTRIREHLAPVTSVRAWPLHT